MDIFLMQKQLEQQKWSYHTTGGEVLWASALTSGHISTCDWPATPTTASNVPIGEMQVARGSVTKL